MLLRNETRGWEKRLVTSSELRIGCKMVNIIESKDGVEVYPEGVVKDKNNDTVDKKILRIRLELQKLLQDFMLTE